MQYINEEMRALLAQIHEKNRLKRETASLEAQQKKLSDKLRELESILRHEQRDVDNLQRITLSTVFMRLNGTHADVLAREQADVAAAALKCDVARREMEDVQKEIAARRKMLGDLHLCEHRYQELLAQKRALLSESAAGERVRSLEEEIARLQAQQKELREAIDAGGSALKTAHEIVDCLKSANGLATWDLLGGGLLVDLAKHNELNNAQVLIERLQHRLRSFKTELSDVQMDLQLPVGDFLSVADYLFDGLIADWMMKKRIGRALEQIENTRDQLENTLARLRAALQNARRAEEDARRKIDLTIEEG